MCRSPVALLDMDIAAVASSSVLVQMEVVVEVARIQVPRSCAPVIGSGRVEAAHPWVADQAWRQETRCQ